MENKRNDRKVREGIVVSDKWIKTVVAAGCNDEITQTL